MSETTKVRSKLEVQLETGLQLQQDLKKMRADLRAKEQTFKEIQNDLLKLARDDKLREIVEGRLKGIVKGRKGPYEVSADALLEYLKAQKKLHLAPSLLKAVTGKVKQYLGEDILKELGNSSHEPYHHIEFQVNLDT